jgi:hypothetical protein
MDNLKGDLPPPPPPYTGDPLSNWLRSDDDPFTRLNPPLNNWFGSENDPLTPLKRELSPQMMRYFNSPTNSDPWREDLSTYQDSSDRLSGASSFKPKSTPSIAMTAASTAAISMATASMTQMSSANSQDLSGRVSDVDYDHSVRAVKSELRHPHVTGGYTSQHVSSMPDQLTCNFEGCTATEKTFKSRSLWKYVLWKVPAFGGVLKVHY